MPPVFSVAATSCGNTEGYDSNLQIGLECGATRPNIFEKLGAAGVSFKVFTDGAIPYASSLFFDIFALNDFGAYDDIEAFEELAASNTLPAVSFIEPNYESETKKLEKDPRNETLQLAAIEMGLLRQNRGAFTEVAMVDRTNRVLAADTNSVFAWPASGGPGTRLNPGDKLIEAAAFDPTGKYVATAHAWDYTVRLWHADGSGLARTLGAATASTETLRFSPDGKHLVVASKDETVQIWRIPRAVKLSGKSTA